jgi:hypothetical protein
MPEIKQDIRTATLIIAASDSLHRNMADYVCDQIADDIEINQALNALPAEGGRVILLEGQYLLAAPIIIPDHDICLEGQSWATFINGNNLATGNHAIQLTSKSNCHLKNFSIRTNAGGGNTCHCIFAEDGCYDLRIDNIYFEDSDSDAIHIEGTSTSRIKIFNCFIEGADDHGIHVTPDALDNSFSFQIFKNHIQSAGFNGIHFSTCSGHYYHLIEGNYVANCDNGIVGAEYLMESAIVNNYCRSNTNDGILLDANCDNNHIDNNYCNDNGGYGINIAAASCSENRILNNKLIGNVTGAIQELGTDTQLPHIFASVPNPDALLGTHAVVTLTDGAEENVVFEFYVPSDFQEMVRAQVFIVPGGTGDMRRSVDTNYGKVCINEDYNTHVDNIAAGEVSVSISDLECIDISAALTLLGHEDLVGVDFTRHGNHANDTVNADCYCLGFRLQYV